MPLAVAVLCHPAGAYTAVVTAIAALVYAWHTRGFVPAFTATAGAILAALAYLQVPPDGRGLLLLGLGVVLLQSELLLPTYGAALLAGVAACLLGSWLLLAVGPGVVQLTPSLRAAIAVAGTIVVTAATLLGFRSYTRAPR